MAFSRISTRISDYLARELKYSEEKKEIIAYSLEGIMFFCAGFIMIMIGGYILGVLKATFVAMLAGIVLRKLSGGLHLSTPLRCLICGAVTYPLVAWLGVQAWVLFGESLAYRIVLVFLLVFSLAVVSIFAPVDSQGKPIVSPSFRKKLKIASILCVIIFGLIGLLLQKTWAGAPVIGGLTLQSLTLLPFLNKPDKNNEGGE